MQLDIPLSQSQPATTNDPYLISQVPSFPLHSLSSLSSFVSSSSCEPHHLSPPQPSVHADHSMITRSKNRIFKPKAYTTNYKSTKIKPTSVLTALANPKWHKVMTKDYQALLNN